MTACLFMAALNVCAQTKEKDSLRVIDLQEVEIISTRATGTTPVAFTNINKEQLKKQNFGQDLPYLLSMTPSAITTSDAGAGIGYTTLRVRGTDGTRINVTANGIPINDAESHNVFWVNLPDFASSVKDMQIQRGAGTSTNGAGAFGASINMQTGDFSLKPYAELNGSYGSFNTHKETVKAGTGLINDHWSFDARLSNISSDGYIDRASVGLNSYYHGQDIVETAKRILERDGKKYLGMSDEERLLAFKDISLNEKLDALRKDLHDFNVDFDNWFSEKSLYPEQVDKALKVLKDEDNLYEKDGALWLRTTKNGDDKDRVVIRTNGVPTYFCSDIAYVGNKIERGYNKLIDIWGADHHGYIIRLKTAMKFLGYNPDDFEIMLLQMVTLLRDGQPVKMSKRTGQAVTLRELMDEVGTDAARYFFCARTLDSQMDFDIDLAKKQSSDNPVYYIQYAHARIHSLFDQAKEAGVKWDPSFAGTDFSYLKEECEFDLIKKMENYHQLLAGAAVERAPQRVAKYAYELAALFHHFYRECRILGVDAKTTEARLGLITAVQYVLAHALAILGVSAPEHM